MPDNNISALICSIKNQFLNITWFDSNGKTQALAINLSNIAFANFAPFPENPYSKTPLSELTGGRTSCLALFLHQPLPMKLPYTLTWQDPNTPKGPQPAINPANLPYPKTYTYWFYSDMERQLCECLFGFYVK